MITQSDALGPFRVEPIDYTTGIDDLRAVREVVFVHEQRVPLAEEWDALDPSCHHVIARDAAGTPIGTGRLTPERKIGRMAVLAGWRGAGVGDALLQALVRQATTLGWTDVALNAQVSAQSFYARHGFDACGERFMEAGIEHQAMRRRLDRPQAVADRAAAVTVTAALIAGARKSIHIRSRDLDPGLFDAPRVLDAMRRFATRGQGNEIRILLHDADAPQRAHAPLLALAQRLPSVLLLREVVDPVDSGYASAFIASDGGGYYFRSLGHRFDGDAELDAAGRARQLVDAFRPVWERSRPCSELRALGL